MSTEVVLEQTDHPVMPRVGSPVDPQVVLDAAVEPPEPTRVDLGKVQHGHGGGASRGVVQDAGKQRLGMKYELRSRGAQSEKLTLLSCRAPPVLGRALLPG